MIEARVEEVILQPKLCLHIFHVGRGNVGVSARDGGQDTQHDIVSLGNKLKQEIKVIVVLTRLQRYNMNCTGGFVSCFCESP